MGPDRTRTRRRFIWTLATTSAAIAGCQSGEETSTATEIEPVPNPSPERTPTPTRTSTATTTGSSIDVVDRLSDLAIPLDTVDPNADLDDLDAFGSAFEDATIVGMGEATHGTREFFRMKHRLLRYMVLEQDLRVFAWEANFSETLMINEYVAGEDVEPESALDNIYFWTWDTESVLEMLEWLRAFNDGRDPADQVRFYGFDVQFAKGPASRLQDYLERTDPDFLETIRADLETVADTGLYPENGSQSERISMVAELTEQIGNRLQERREDYEEIAGEEAWQLADRHNYTMDRARAYIEADRTVDQSPVAIRDDAMAANVSWLHEFEDGARMALWAHNNHVHDSLTVGTADPSMGMDLTERFGEEYYSIGFDFAHGEFRSVSLTTGEMRKFQMDNPHEDTLSATLHSVSPDLYALNFGSVSGDLRDVLNVNFGIHMIGASYNPDWPMNTIFPPTNLTVDYDGLVFVAESTATTLLDDLNSNETATETATDS